MEVLVMHHLDAAGRLRLDLESGRNDGWTEAMMRSRIEKLEDELSSNRDLHRFVETAA